MKKYLLAAAVLMSITTGVQAQSFGETIARALGNSFGNVFNAGLTSAECAASAFGTAAIQGKLTGSQALGGYAGSANYSRCASAAEYRRERERSVQDSFRYRAMEEQYQGLARWNAQSTTSVHNGQVSHQAVVNQSAGGFGALPMASQASSSGQSVQRPAGMPDHCQPSPIGNNSYEWKC